MGKYPKDWADRRVEGLFEESCLHEPEDANRKKIECKMCLAMDFRDLVSSMDRCALDL